MQQSKQWCPVTQGAVLKKITACYYRQLQDTRGLPKKDAQCEKVRTRKGWNWFYLAKRHLLRRTQLSGEQRLPRADNPAVNLEFPSSLLQVRNNSCRSPWPSCQRRKGCISLLLWKVNNRPKFNLGQHPCFLSNSSQPDWPSREWTLWSHARVSIFIYFQHHSLWLTFPVL